jgi:hypothetical protein
MEEQKARLLRVIASWVMPVIPPTWEVETERITDRDHPEPKKLVKLQLNK